MDRIKNLLKSYAKIVLNYLSLSTKTGRYNPIHHKDIKLTPENGEKRGTALLAFILEPFLMEDRSSIPSSHTHFIESLLIADVLLELGYEVDVISFENTTFYPQKNYDLFISSRKYFQRYAELLNSNCKKVVLITVAHWLFNNTAAISRCLNVQQRKGTTLNSYRLMEENWAIEHTDYAIFREGNGFAKGTYDYAGKPSYYLPIPTYTVYPKPNGKDYDKIRKNFVWFGSLGFIHKGLDLVLDAFSEMPEYNLYVCGPVNKDEKFEEAYHKELYETDNIELIGWVDITSDKFLEIMNDSVGVVYPSCSEGGGGAVITCMQAGLIPITTYESNVKIKDDYGIKIKDLKVGEVKKSVRKVSEMPTDKLESMALQAWKYARENNTKENYSSCLEEILKDIINDK